MHNNNVREYCKKVTFEFINEMGTSFKPEKNTQIAPKHIHAIMPLKKTKPGKLTVLFACFQQVLLIPNEMALNNPKKYEIND